MGLNVMCSRLPGIISIKNLYIIPRTRIQIAKFHSLTREVPKHLIKNIGVQKRTFILKIFRRPTKTQLKIKDNIPDNYKLIYRNTMDRYLLLAQFITTTTAVIVALSIVYKGDFSNFQLPFSDDVPNRPRETENELLIYLAAFVLAVGVLQMFLSKMPLRIYNFPQKKEYKAVFYGNLPFTYRQEAFKAGELSKIEETGLSPWQQGKYQLKNGQKIILMDEYFRRSADLFIMLGVQRDPDVDDKDN